MTTKIGTRVTLTNAVEHYPLGIFDAGLTGTLVSIDDLSGAYWVKLDKHFPELAEWENELEIPDHTQENDGAYHPETYLDGDTIESLCAEYQAKLAAFGLPQMSADELLNEELTKAQRDYVSAFYHRWEAMTDRSK